MTKTERTIKAIDAALDAVCTMHYEAVKAEALRVMRTHPNLKMFCMGMGSADFRDFKGASYSGADGITPKYMMATFDILDEFDCHLKTSGTTLIIKRMSHGGPLVLRDGH